MLKGKVTSVFGDDVNTDDIIPAVYLQQSNDPAFFAPHAFANIDPEFKARCQPADANVVVAGKNFACGSSREQAVYALQYNKVVCVIARSFPDIFYRNSLSNGLPLIVVPDPTGLQLGDDLEIDLDAGVITNRARGTTLRFEMKPGDRTTFKAGGMTTRVRAHLEEILLAQR